MNLLKIVFGGGLPPEELNARSSFLASLAQARSGSADQAAIAAHVPHSSIFYFLFSPAFSASTPQRRAEN